MLRLLKLSIITLLLAVTICFASCAPITKEGLGEFSAATSSMGLTAYLLPNDSFLTQFDYIDGNYHYFDNDIHTAEALEKCMLWLKYDESQYNMAKEHCITQMALSEKNIKTCGDYVFIENLALTQNSETADSDMDSHFPYFFVMFGYNDTLNELFFIGYRCGKYVYNDIDAPMAELANTDFGVFLKNVYSEYYDFKW